MSGFPSKVLVAGALFAAVAARADPPPADPANDPLPPGAVARCGVSRPILRGNPGVALVPPTFKNFLAPTEGGGIRRYDMATGRPLDKAATAGELVAAGRVVVSTDGRRAAVSRPGSLTVVDAETGKRLLAVEPPAGVVLVGVAGAALSADGSVLAFGGRGKDGKGEVVVLDVDANEVAARFETVQLPPVFPTLSPDGKTLVTHGPPPAAPAARTEPAPAPAPPAAATTPPAPDLSRTAQVWDVPTGKERFRTRVTGMDGTVVAAAFSPDGSLLAASAGDGPVDVWDAVTGKRRHTLLGRKGQGVRVAFSPDGKKVASVAADYRVQFWASDGTPLGVAEPPPDLLNAALTGLVFVDSETAVAWQTVSQFVVAWDAPAGQLLSPFTDHVAGIRSIAIPEGTKDLYTSGLDTRVCRWEAATGQLNEVIRLHPARLPAQPVVRPVVALSADARLATWPRTPAEVFDVRNGSDLFSVPAPSAPPAAADVIMSADGTRAVSVAAPTPRKRTTTTVVWDLLAQKRLGELDLPVSRTPPRVSLSPSGSRLVAFAAVRNPTTGQETLTVAAWDVRTGKKLSEVRDPAATGQVHLIAADETTALLSSSGGRLWSVDFETGATGPDLDKMPVRRDEAGNTHLAVSPDGKLLAVGSVADDLEGYGVRVYDWRAGKRTHTFSGHLGPVTALRFGPDGKTLASGSQDTSVVVWNLDRPDPPAE